MFERDLSLKKTHADHEWHPKHFDVVACLYICALITTWITIPKLFAAGPFTFSGGVLVYPLTCIFGDTLTEIYGFNRTRRLIWMGFICGLIFLFFTQLAIALPVAPDFKLQEAFAAVNGQMPRVVIASYTAYLGCEFSNSYIMSKMKVWSNADNFPLRALASTVVAQFVDSAVFFIMAFAGILSVSALIKIIVVSSVAKILYETLLLPVTNAFVRKLKSLEGIEHFDHGELRMLKF
ncbi:MAG: queuosine precursor transporter [Bdellovibrionales bacterium]